MTDKNGAHTLEIVMYHYVRNSEESGFPSLPARRLDEFERQLDHLQQNYNLVTPDQVIASFKDPAQTLPEKSVLLSFDDGYQDHARNVLPSLVKRGISGVFFPVASTVVERKVLTVNKIQFLLAGMRDHAKLRTELDIRIREGTAAWGLRSPQEYWSEWGKPGRWDPAETFYLKRMLQKGLPRALGETIADEFFQRYVTQDEAAFAEQLYMSDADARAMIEAGMTLGNHTYSHGWLTEMDEDESGREIDAGLSYLQNVGQSLQDWIMCYPFGGYNESVMEQVRSKGASLGLTVAHGSVQPDQSDAMCLSRIDTNLIPYD